MEKLSHLPYKDKSTKSIAIYGAGLLGLAVIVNSFSKLFCVSSSITVLASLYVGSWAILVFNNIIVFMEFSFIQKAVINEISQEIPSSGKGKL